MKDDRHLSDIGSEAYNICCYKFDLISRIRHILKAQYDINFKDSTETSIVNVLTNQFASGSAKSTYNDCIFLEKDGLEYKTSDTFIENLRNEEFKKIVVELIEFGIDRYKRFYSDRYMGTNFQLYQNIHMRMSADCYNGIKTRLPLILAVTSLI